ncbi:hypothetical protein AZE99_01515 [Sphingorhabdus sp. M41]|nr:hypothetical protein AZE99_01515 [Sphingorhabdus sp. M41]
MEMIAMSSIVIGAENGAKTLAGAVMDRGEKLHLPATALPVILNRYPAAIGEHKSGHVDCIGVGVLRQFSGSGDIATTIAAHGFDPLEVTAEIFARRTFHGIFGPCGKFARQFTFDWPQVGYICADIEQLDTINLAATATELPVG